MRRSRFTSSRLILVMALGVASCRHEGSATTADLPESDMVIRHAKRETELASGALSFVELDAPRLMEMVGAATAENLGNLEVVQRRLKEDRLDVPVTLFGHFGRAVGGQDALVVEACCAVRETVGVRLLVLDTVAGNMIRLDFERPLEAKDIEVCTQMRGRLERVPWPAFRDYSAVGTRPWSGTICLPEGPVNAAVAVVDRQGGISNFVTLVQFDFPALDKGG